MDNERLAFGATSSPCTHLTSSEKKGGGGVSNGVHSTHASSV